MSSPGTIDSAFFNSSLELAPVSKVEPGTTYFRFTPSAPPRVTEIIQTNYRLHKTMLESSSDASASNRPICFVVFGAKQGAANKTTAGSAAIPLLASEYYTKIEGQLKRLSEATTDDQEVERGAVDTALSVIDELKNRSVAPPVISWHGGDAVVMLWALGDTTYAITVTDGELGYVVRRKRKTMKLADSISLDQFKLEDLR